MKLLIVAMTAANFMLIRCTVMEKERENAIYVHTSVCDDLYRTCTFRMVLCKNADYAKTKGATQSPIWMHATTIRYYNPSKFD